MNPKMILQAVTAMALMTQGFMKPHRYKYQATGVYWPSTSKYKPHQGKREIARRASQIERGILQVS